MQAKICIQTSDNGVEKVVGKEIFQQFADAVQNLPVGEEVAVDLHNSGKSVPNSDVCEIPLFYKYFTTLGNVLNAFRKATGMELSRETKKDCREQHPECFWSISFADCFFATNKFLKYNQQNGSKDAGKIVLYIDE